MLRLCASLIYKTNYFVIWLISFLLSQLLDIHKVHYSVTVSPWASWIVLPQYTWMFHQAMNLQMRVPKFHQWRGRYHLHHHSTHSEYQCSEHTNKKWLEQNYLLNSLPPEFFSVDFQDTSLRWAPITYRLYNRRSADRNFFPWSLI